MLSPLTGALLQGFAVLSSDAGHSNAQGGPAFGLDPQARLDYGYQAVGKLTPMAKQAIGLAYGKGPDRSYFGGCSNGGRHTLVAASRYGDDYDGFLAGAPGYNLPKAALANIFGAQRYASVATNPSDIGTGFTAAERQLVSAAVLARCDALDGAAPVLAAGWIMVLLVQGGLKYLINLRRGLVVEKVARELRGRVQALTRQGEGPRAPRSADERCLRKPDGKSLQRR